MASDYHIGQHSFRLYTQEKGCWLIEYVHLQFYKILINVFQSSNINLYIHKQYIRIINSTFLMFACKMFAYLAI